MGIRHKKEVELAVEHYSTKLYVKLAQCCSQCPLKLYAEEDDKIIFGTGNIMTDTIMILPSYDVKAGIGYPTMLKILQDAYRDIKGMELLEECYVTRGIKCLNKTDFNLEKDAIKSCITNLSYEICRIRPRKIIIFDKFLYDFISAYYTIIFPKIYQVVSPGVMYYDNQNLKYVFMKQLNEALNDS